jgi:hypothetical protein
MTAAGKEPRGRQDRPEKKDIETVRVAARKDPLDGQQQENRALKDSVPCCKKRALESFRSAVGIEGPPNGQECRR